MPRTIRDRMNVAGPLWKAMASRFDAMVEAINELRAIVVSGQNPHKANDAVNTVLASNAGEIEGVIDLAQELITKYEAHIGSATFHTAADTTNVVTEVGVPMEVYALLNELKVDLNAHMQDATAHTNDDDVTSQVSSADASTKASAITLGNELLAAYEAHRVRLEDAGTNAVHGAADATNVMTEDTLEITATWTEIAALADDLRTQYEAHRVLTTGSVHASGDTTNTVTAAAVGTVTDALYAGLNELKGDFNTHTAEFGTFHAMKDASIEVTEADASSVSTAKVLVNAMKAAFNDHITRGDSFTEIPSLDQVT